MNAAAAALPSTYLCRRCGACCRWPGFVRLEDASIKTISAFLGIDERTFVERYTDLLPSRTGLMLKSRPDHSCILYDGAACLIHPVKPPRCREFPDSWNFPGWRQICRAVRSPA